MANPFSNIVALKAFINQFIIPNGMREIDGQEMNDVTNSLADFIVQYAINGSLADIQSGNLAYTVEKPVVVFAGNPSSITVPDNVQNFYIFANATGFDIPFNSAFSYFDLYENEQVVIPLRQSIILAKNINGSWTLVNNLSGSGGGGDLPPQTGNAGKFLSTNGSSAGWFGISSSFTNANFSNATDLPIPNLSQFSASVYWSDAANFIYESKNEWEYLAGRAGIKILVPGFDATAFSYNFEIFYKPL